jgi:hypothetical protein
MAEKNIPNVTPFFLSEQNGISRRSREYIFRRPVPPGFTGGRNPKRRVAG